MTAVTNDRNPSSGNRFAHLEVDHLAGLVERITAGEYIDGRELAERLRNHGSRPIPETVLDHICRHLDDTVTKPKGRKSLPTLDRSRRDMIIGGLYRRYLAYLTERERRYGHHAGWTKGEYPPGETAARLVARFYYYGEESWRSVQNIASRK